MNNLPKKYTIKCRYAELGATTLSGYPKYHMRALLLQLHYYNYYFPKNIYSAYQGEIRKLKKELTVSKDYITGTLLGYRPSSIKGYCINIQLNSHIYKKYDTREKYDELVSSPHYLSELKKARALYIETSHYRIFTREYPKFTKICNVWIEYMLNDSNMFKKYYDKYKKKITMLSV
jgi:hypothetical protein